MKLIVNIVDANGNSSVKNIDIEGIDTTFGDVASNLGINFTTHQVVDPVRNVILQKETFIRDVVNANLATPGEAAIVIVLLPTNIKGNSKELQKEAIRHFGFKNIKGAYKGYNILTKEEKEKVDNYVNSTDTTEEVVEKVTEVKEVVSNVNSDKFEDYVRNNIVNNTYLPEEVKSGANAFLNKTTGNVVTKFVETVKENIAITWKKYRKL